MIVDFVLIKEKLDDNRDFVLEIFSRQSPLLKLVPHKIHHEGNKGTYETTDHKQKNSEMLSISSSVTFTKEEMENITYNEILEKWIEAGKDMAGQKEKQAIAKIKSEINNGFSFSNSSSLSDIMLNGLDAIHIEFSDDNKGLVDRNNPILSPSLGLLIENNGFIPYNVVRNKFTENDKLREKEILDKKFKEYQIRESKRVLID